MSVDQLYQTTTPYESLADLLGRLLNPDAAAGEGLYWGGALTSGEAFPAFLALVQDDSGRLWPCGASSSIPIDFSETSGTLSLFLIPFDSSELPSYVTGKIGAFSLVATASSLNDALELGSGSVTDSAFTSFTEAAGVRVDALAIGSGTDDDIYLYARNGDANQPGLRYQASGDQWQYSNDGSTWYAFGTAAGSVASVFGRTGAVVAETGDYTAAQVGAAPTSRTISAGTGLTGGGDLSADRALAIDAGGVDTTQLANNAVTLAKLQQISTDKLLGRATSGTGAVEEIACTAAGRALLDDADAAAQRATLGLYAKGSTAPGSPSDGDLWYDTGNQILWVYNGTVERWLQAESQTLSLSPNLLPPYASTSNNTLTGALPYNFDIRLDSIRVNCFGAAGTWDGSNYWRFNFYVYTTLLGYVDKQSVYFSDLVFTSGTLINTTTTPYLRCDVVKTGSPGNLTDLMSVSAQFRLAKK